jgi:cysteine-rich repeat protein
VFINTINLFVDIPDWYNIYVTTVNVMNDTAVIQDAVDIVDDPGFINVAPGTYDGFEVPANAGTLTITGDPGSHTTSGAGASAPILQGDGDFSNTDNVGVDVLGGVVTLRGFIMEDFYAAVRLDKDMKHGFTLDNNTIRDNYYALFNDNSNPGVHIHYNWFQNNLYAIWNNVTGGSQYIEAQNNYWGCPTGPVVEHTKNGVTKYYQWSYGGEGTAVPIVGFDPEAEDCEVLGGLKEQHWSHNPFGWSPFKIKIEAVTDDFEKCGDGILQGNEQCDDGNNVDGDGCSAICTIEPPSCGDGILDTGAGETCEVDPASGLWGDCREGLCTYCGDGVVDPGLETCDPGIGASWEWCSDTCQVIPGCGNGILESGETCEVGPDGSWGDCREDLCTYCGDGVVDPNEQCDLGAANSDEPGATCRTDCTPAECGDGIVDPDEQCDEGANNSDEPGATCRTDCTPAECGDGIVDPDEQCDEGANNSDEPGAT